MDGQPVGAATAVALGERRRLHPASVTVQRLARWMAAGIISVLLSVQLLGGLLEGRPLWELGLEFAVFLALAILWAQIWPGLSYRYASYVVSADGIEIRRGVLWRTVVNVPRSRVQHTDVSQGPVERGYDLGSLSIYTAGTDHARVRLPGLAHATAMAIRNHLLPGGTDDAV